MNMLVTQTLNALLMRARATAGATPLARDSASHGAPHHGWDAETGPAVFRSEGFAEDLDDSYAAH